MAEIVTGPLPPAANEIFYSEQQLASFARKYSELTAIEAGDRCTHCGQDCDRAGFHPYTWSALRVQGKPYCGRAKCYDALWDAFRTRRK